MTKFTHVLTQIEEVVLTLVKDGQTQVRYAGGPVSLHQDVLRLDVPVSNGWLTFIAKNLCNTK